MSVSGTHRTPTPVWGNLTVPANQQASERQSRGPQYIDANSVSYYGAETTPQSYSLAGTAESRARDLDVNADQIAVARESEHFIVQEMYGVDAVVGVSRSLARTISSEARPTRTNARGRTYKPSELRKSHLEAYIEALSAKAELTVNEQEKLIGASYMLANWTGFVRAGNNNRMSNDDLTNVAKLDGDDDFVTIHEIMASENADKGYGKNGSFFNTALGIAAGVAITFVTGGAGAPIAVAAAAGGASGQIVEGMMTGRDWDDIAENAAKSGLIAGVTAGVTSAAPVSRYGSHAPGNSLRQTVQNSFVQGAVRGSVVTAVNGGDAGDILENGLRTGITSAVSAGLHHEVVSHVNEDWIVNENDQVHVGGRVIANSIYHTTQNLVHSAANGEPIEDIARETVAGFAAGYTSGWAEHGLDSLFNENGVIGQSLDDNLGPTAGAFIAGAVTGGGSSVLFTTVEGLVSQGEVDVDELLISGIQGAANGAAGELRRLPEREREAQKRAIEREMLKLMDAEGIPEDYRENVQNIYRARAIFNVTKSPLAFRAFLPYLDSIADDPEKLAAYTDAINEMIDSGDVKFFESNARLINFERVATVMGLIDDYSVLEGVSSVEELLALIDVEQLDRDELSRMYPQQQKLIDDVRILKELMATMDLDNLTEEDKQYLKTRMIDPQMIDDLKKVYDVDAMTDESLKFLNAAVIYDQLIEVERDEETGDVTLSDAKLTEWRESNPVIVHSHSGDPGGDVVMYNGRPRTALAYNGLYVDGRMYVQQTGYMASMDTVEDGNNILAHENIHYLQDHSRPEELRYLTDYETYKYLSAEEQFWYRASIPGMTAEESKAMYEEYQRLQAAYDRGQLQHIGSYALKSKNTEEFFADTMEMFFERPDQVRTDSPYLYEQYTEYVNQPDRAVWSETIIERQNSESDVEEAEEENRNKTGN